MTCSVTLGQVERLELHVAQLGPHHHRVAQQVAIAIDQQHAAAGAQQQPALRDVADQLGVELFEVAVVKARSRHISPLPR